MASITLLIRSRTAGTVTDRNWAALRARPCWGLHSSCSLPNVVVVRTDSSYHTQEIILQEDIYEIHSIEHNHHFLLIPHTAEDFALQGVLRGMVTDHAEHLLPNRNCRLAMSLQRHHCEETSCSLNTHTLLKRNEMEGGSPVGTESQTREVGGD